MFGYSRLVPTARAWATIRTNFRAISPNSTALTSKRLISSTATAYSGVQQSWLTQLRQRYQKYPNRNKVLAAAIAGSISVGYGIWKLVTDSEVKKLDHIKDSVISRQICDQKEREVRKLFEKFQTRLMILDQRDRLARTTEIQSDLAIYINQQERLAEELKNINFSDITDIISLYHLKKNIASCNEHINERIKLLQFLHAIMSSCAEYSYENLNAAYLHATTAIRNFEEVKPLLNNPNEILSILNNFAGHVSRWKSKGVEDFEQLTSAETYFQTAIDYNPENFYALSNLGYVKSLKLELCSGQSFLSTARKTALIAELTAIESTTEKPLVIAYHAKAFDKAAEDPSVLCGYGWASYVYAKSLKENLPTDRNEAESQQKQVDKLLIDAENYSRRALNHSRNNPAILYNLAKILEYQGSHRHEEAKEYIKQARDEKPGDEKIELLFNQLHGNRFTRLFRFVI